MRKKGKSRAVLHYALLIIIALTIGLSWYSFNAESVSGNKMPMPFGCGCSVVLSGSMEPELSVNDLVIIKQQDVYEVGDIVVYQADGELIIHRIIELTDDGVITKGDANNASDGEISLSSIKGKAVAVIPRVGAIVEAVKTPVGTLLVLAVAIFLLERSYRRERSQKQLEAEKIKEEIRKLKEENTENSD